MLDLTFRSILNILIYRILLEQFNKCGLRRYLAKTSIYKLYFMFAIWLYHNIIRKKTFEFSLINLI